MDRLGSCSKRLVSEKQASNWLGNSGAFRLKNGLVCYRFHFEHRSAYMDDHAQFTDSGQSSRNALLRRQFKMAPSKHKTRTFHATIPVLLLNPTKPSSDSSCQQSWHGVLARGVANRSRDRAVSLSFRRMPFSSVGASSLETALCWFHPQAISLPPVRQKTPSPKREGMI
jgi:hypothetical protein